MYSQAPDEVKISKKFVPIFPFLYNEIKNG
jgi:hypothetical protein